MSSWRECKLGDVAKIKHGWAFKSEYFTEENTDEPILVNIGNFKYSGGFRFESTKIKRYTADYPKEYELKGGEILLIMTCQTEGGEILGIPAKIPNDNKVYLHNQRLGKVEILDSKRVDLDFLYWYFLTYEFNQSLVGSASGTKILHTAPNRIENTNISLPPLEEQKAIAEVLSSLDDKIDLLHRQNHTLESLAQTLFRQWFIEEAKEEWEEKPLGEITNIAIGRTPPRKEEEWFSIDSKDVKWISIKDLGNDGAFIYKTSEYLTQEAVERFNVPVIPKDTVVLSFKMTVGRVAITTETMLSNEAIAHFKFHDKTPIIKEYLYLFLKTYPYDSLGSTSSIVTAINSAMIKEMMILIPDEETMKKFSSIVEPQFEKIRQNQQQIQTLENLRDTLLPKLLSGEVRVKYE